MVEESWPEAQKSCGLEEWLSQAEDSIFRHAAASASDINQSATYVQTDRQKSSYPLEAAST